VRRWLGRRCEPRQCCGADTVTDARTGATLPFATRTVATCTVATCTVATWASAAACTVATCASAAACTRTLAVATGALAVATGARAQRYCDARQLRSISRQRDLQHAHR
jgi:hypothetical protein